MSTALKHGWSVAATDIALARKISSRLKPSRHWQTMRHVDTNQRTGDSGQLESVQVWSNRWYLVTARHYDRGWLLDGGPWAQLGISCPDGEARHDWRDFQRIKNDLCGPEWEALELFPAESRLIDPSNYYILYCAPKLPFGKHLGARQVAGPRDTIAPQRPWSGGDEPPELKREVA